MIVFSFIMSQTPSNSVCSTTKGGKTKSTGLKKCFTALVDRKPVFLDVKVLHLMLQRELMIETDKLESVLVEILPYMLIYYIKTWPGWQKSGDYFSGKIVFKVWYQKFHSYILLRLNQLINERYAVASESCNKEKKANKNLVFRGSQTDNLAPKGFSPFSIDITAPANVANIIVFTGIDDYDVVLKPHNEVQWDKTTIDSITLNQVLQWPHIEVRFSTPAFEFRRRNLHTYKRHIELVNLAYVHTSVEFIEEVRTLNHNVKRECLTLDLIKQISEHFMLALKTVMKEQERLDEILAIIDEFLSDIQEIGIYRKDKITMATNTSVLFNIGSRQYFRNKKLSKGPSRGADINFVETLIPKVEIALTRFSYDRAFDDYISFLKTNTTKELKQKLLPEIGYGCNYCKVELANAHAVLMHLKHVHKMEQGVLCTSCKQPCSILNLTDDRWNHACTKRPRMTPSARLITSIKK